jgi:Ser/Thr protein kinase RdoA (MazF antagonist)
MERGVLSRMGTYPRTPPPSSTHLLQPSVWLASRLAAGAGEGLQFIQANDKELAHCIDAILAGLELQGDAFGEVGMIHADLGPQNFRYDPDIGITAFDFDNCCRHWFLYDIAVSLSVLRLRPEREQLVQWMFEGYRDLRPFSGDPGSLRPLLRLRLLYVYCDRLCSFGVAPGPDKTNILSALRDRLLLDDVW